MAFCCSSCSVDWGMMSRHVWMIENNNNTPFDSLVVGERAELWQSKLKQHLCKCLARYVFVYRNAHPNIYKITVQIINYIHILNIAGVYRIIIILWFVARRAECTSESECSMWFIVGGCFSNFVFARCLTWFRPYTTRNVWMH